MRATISLLIAPLASLVQSSPVVVQRQAADSINDLYRGTGKAYFGTIAEQNKLVEGKNAAIIQSNFGQITPEWSMKWEATEKSKGQFTFNDADAFMNFASENKKQVRGHTLLWHRALPEWVQAITSREELTAVIENHVTTLVARYKGRIRSWDVVNEIFSDDGTLRPSVFSSVLGEDFVGIAFRAARAADPNAKLYINDYSLDNEYWTKVPITVQKVNEWTSQGIPIDGIGSQTHLHAGGAGAIESALRALAKANVSEVAVTELDIEGADPEEYKTVVEACYHVPTCAGVTVWGVSDKDSWIADKTPLLFDSNYNAKPAYQSIVDYIKTLKVVSKN